MGTVLNDQGYAADVHGLPDDIYGGFFSDAYAYDANDVGQVVGQATSSTDGRRRAYLWKDKVMVEIGTFGGAAGSASAINRRGVVVGWADRADGTRHAFAYRDGRLHDLGTLGGSNSFGRAVPRVCLRRRSCSPDQRSDCTDLADRTAAVDDRMGVRHQRQGMDPWRCPPAWRPTLYGRHAQASAVTGLGAPLMASRPRELSRRRASAVSIRAARIHLGGYYTDRGRLACRLHDARYGPPRTHP